MSKLGSWRLGTDSDIAMAASLGRSLSTPILAIRLSRGLRGMIGAGGGPPCLR